MIGPGLSLGTLIFLYAINLGRNQVTDDSAEHTNCFATRPRSRISAMPEFITVATVEEIPPGIGRTVEVQGVWIALFNVDGSFYAVDNTCPHAGGPLGEGHLDGHVVECPWHGWRYNVQTGERPENPNITVACCSVRIEGN